MDRHVLEQRMEFVVELGLDVADFALRERGGDGVGNCLGELLGDVGVAEVFADAVDERPAVIAGAVVVGVLEDPRQFVGQLGGDVLGLAAGQRLAERRGSACERRIRPFWSPRPLVMWSRHRLRTRDKTVKIKE